MGVWAKWSGGASAREWGLRPKVHPMLRAPQLRAVRTSMSVSPIMTVWEGWMVRPAMRPASSMRDSQAVRIGFLGVEAVASVVLEEEAREAEVVADVA